jgi:flagellar export protein FliJ
VLEYNTHIQKNEKDKLAVLNSEFMELETQKKQLIQEYKFQNDCYISSCSEGITVIEATIRLNYIGEIQNRIKLQEKKLEEKRLQIEKQTEKLVEVTKEKVKVEKLRENKLSQYKGSERKNDEKFIEEFISNRRSTAL